MAEPDPDDKQHPLRSIVIGVAVFVAAAVAFLNGLPQFIDETLPWLGERIPIGDLDPTVWEVAAVFVAVNSAVIATMGSLTLARAGRRLREDYTVTYNGELVPRRQPGQQHSMAAVGGTTITCSCGWRGPGWEFEAHKREGTST